MAAVDSTEKKGCRVQLPRTCYRFRAAKPKPFGGRVRPTKARQSLRPLQAAWFGRPEDLEFVDRVLAKVDSADGPPPLHQFLRSYGVPDLTPFARTGLCLFSFDRVKREFEPKVAALRQEGLSPAQVIEVLREGRCSSVSYWKVFWYNMGYLRGVMAAATHQEPPPPPPLTRLGVLLAARPAVLGRALSLPPNRLRTTLDCFRKWLGGSRQLLADVLATSPELFVVKGARGAEVLLALSEALGEGSEALLPELRAAPGVLRAAAGGEPLPAATVLLCGGVLRVLRRELGLSLDQLARVAMHLHGEAAGSYPSTDLVAASLKQLRAAAEVAEAAAQQRPGQWRQWQQQQQQQQPCQQAAGSSSSSSGVSALDASSAAAQRVAKIVLSGPGLLLLPPAQLQANLAALQALLGPQGALRVAFTSPAVLRAGSLEEAPALQLLSTQLHMGQAEVQHMVRRCSALLGLPGPELERQLCGLIDAFDRRLDAVRRVVLAAPKALLLPDLAASTGQLLSELEALLGQREAAVHCTCRDPALLAAPARLRHTCAQFLQEQCGLSRGQLQQAVQRHPRLLRTPPASVSAAAKLLQQHLGLSQEQVRRLMWDNPSVLTVRTGRPLALKLQWAALRCPWPAEELLGQPLFLPTGLERLASRLAFLDRTWGQERVRAAGFSLLTSPPATFYKRAGVEAEEFEQWVGEWLQSEEAQRWGLGSAKQPQGKLQPVGGNAGAAGPADHDMAWE